MWVARINIVLVGFVVVFGALFVGELGGAFEANKLLTGLFALPLAIPLVLGLLFRKTNPLGAFLSVMTGIVLGLTLNTLTAMPWEVATLTQIVACTVVFFVSGWLIPSSEGYQKRVNSFFTKINTALRPDEITQTDPFFKRSLANLFSVAIALSGILFSAMSIPSLSQTSGQVALGMGGICLLMAVYLKLKFTGTLTLQKKRKKNA